MSSRAFELRLRSQLPHNTGIPERCPTGGDAPHRRRQS